MDVKTTDKKMTLLHFLAELIEEKYPELLNFFNTFEINVDKGGEKEVLICYLHLFKKALLKQPCQYSFTPEILETVIENGLLCTAVGW